MNTSGKALVALYLHRKGEQVHIGTDYNTEYNCQYMQLLDDLPQPPLVDGAASEAGPGGREDGEPEAGRHLPFQKLGRRLQDRCHIPLAQSWRLLNLYSIIVFFFSQGMVGLSKALRVFEDEGLNLVHIESRKVKGSKDKVQHHRLYSSVFPSLHR